MDVLPGTVPDHMDTLEFVEQSEVRAGVPVAEATRNTYYGDAATPSGLCGRATQAGLPARRDDPTTSSSPRMTSSTNWSGDVARTGDKGSRTIVPVGKRRDRAGRVHRIRTIRFVAAVCQGSSQRYLRFSAKVSRSGW